MSIHPEIRGRKMPRVALAAAALLAFSAEHSSRDKADSSLPKTETIKYNDSSDVFRPPLNLIGGIVLKQNYSNTARIEDETLSQIVKKPKKIPLAPPATPPPTTTTTTAPLTPQQIAENSITPTEYAMWYKVHECEEPEVYDKATGQLISGGWNVAGSNSSGGLGILDRNWLHFGGGLFAPTGNLADPKAQMYVARNIQISEHMQSYVPDQNGCSRTGW